MARTRKTADSKPARRSVSAKGKAAAGSRKSSAPPEASETSAPAETAQAAEPRRRQASRRTDVTTARTGTPRRTQRTRRSKSQDTEAAQTQQELLPLPKTRKNDTEAAEHRDAQSVEPHVEPPVELNREVAEAQPPEETEAEEAPSDSVLLPSDGDQALESAADPSREEEDEEPTASLPTLASKPEQAAPANGHPGLAPQALSTSAPHGAWAPRNGTTPKQSDQSSLWGDVGQDSRFDDLADDALSDDDPDVAAALAFWRAPDELKPWSVPRPAPPPRQEAPSAPEPSGSGPGLGDGRRRRRRRRRGAATPVPTELPIDSPEMAAVVRRLRQFGLREFRPGQERVVRNVLACKNTLAIMPTGSGKSLTFQLPGMVLEGVTIVVSPLLALMKDQTDKLRKRGIHAARLDSTLTTVGEREMLQEIEEGVRKLIYVTPERAASPDFKEELGGRPVALFVIDEAHCVSQWGHDFRPSYLNLKRAIELLGRPPVLALTATATPRVVEDIQERLALREPEVVHLGFARPELIFEVRSVPDEKAQVRRLVRLVRRIKGSGIVYASTINTVEALSGALSRLGMRVGKYHGKMSKEDRDTEQHKFMKNQVRVMIATNAFGLGVDKPDIRFVIHYNLPGSIEQYYQEAGRAGRDGKPARGILLWRPGDEDVQKHFNIQKYPGRDQVRSVVAALTAGPGKLEEIALRAGVPQKKAQVVLAMLEESQLAKELPGPIWSPAENAADEATVWRAAEAYRKKREGDRERLQAMLDYAEGRKCRVQYLLGYFGEEAPACSRCDVCTGRIGIGEDEETDEFETARPLPVIPEAPPPPRKDPTTMF